jgi:alpha-2-macroglobulin
MKDRAEEPEGLRFRLSEGTEQPVVPQNATTVAPSSRLSESETQNVLKRLPPLKAEPTDEQDLALRDRSLPPPRTGKTVSAVFPPPVETARPDTAVNAGPLEVLRYSPEGDVPIAPQLSVTFSQPMTAVTSIEQLAAGDVPVQLTPQPKGRWRWVGTKTLLFEPEDRLPMATDYRVSVPAGTKSATGTALTRTRAWSFSTPPPQLKTKYPQDGPQRRDALIFMEFDQRIDPASVLRTIKVNAGRASLSVRPATPQEVEADEAVRKLVGAAGNERWIALRATGPASADARTALPGDAQINVTVGPGTPSAEGPRTTTKAETFSFRTFGPMRVDKSQCGYERTCSPFDNWSITFTNPLDAEAFQKSSVRVEPEVTGLKTEIYGNTLNIEGLKRGRTTYKVTLDKSIRDQFGQTLDETATIVFNVGAAPQALFSSGEDFVTLDPAGPPRFSIFSVNHDRLKVSLYRVGPQDWSAFTNYMRQAQGYRDEASQKQATPPGRQVFSKVLEVKSKPDEMVETAIDLSPALERGLGQSIVIVEPVVVQPKNRREQRVIRAWVQATQIGLDAFVDRTDLTGWANSLKDGRPLAGVQMTVLPSGETATSSADGTARIALTAKQSAGLNLLVARSGSDLAILPENFAWWNREGGWHRREAADFLRWYVFDDRKMYRPGEEVHIKGWIRRVGGGREGDVGPLGDGARSVSYRLMDSRGNQVGKGTLSINALGGFDTALKLPGTMNLGYVRMELQAEGGAGYGGMSLTFSHNFQVQEFRRPEFEVTAQASEGPHKVGGHADASVTAAYFAGGGLPNTEVHWSVTSTPANYTPPNRGDYSFGKWIPWWIASNSDGESRTETFQGRTDDAGKHRLRIDFESVNPPRASNVTAQATVTDVNRQAWTAKTDMLVHPSDLYVGLRSDRTFVQQGEPLVVESIVTDIDGKAVAGQAIKMRAVMLDWTFKQGEWVQEETSPQDCTVQSAQQGVKCTFEAKTGGTYRVTARVLDERERPNESELTLWVAGGKQPPKREVEQETVEMIPDRKEYKPGDTAQVLVQAPFYPAEGIMTLRRSGLLKSERFRMDGPTMTLKVPIEEGFIPNLFVQVDLVGAAARTDDAGKTDERLPKRPAYAKGELNLSVPPMQRRLTVQATPRDKALEPGAETVVNVEVRDAASRPVAGSEVAVVVVDESVLALTSYKLEDPLSIFYAQRSADVSDYHLREKVLLSNPEILFGESMAVGGGGGGAPMTEAAYIIVQEMPSPAPPPSVGFAARMAKSAPGQGDSPQIRLRENFNALAVFAAAVPTDASGRAQVQVKLPDNLTRYRVMAVSVAGGKQFGSGESAITARQPLMVRPSAPRFLNFGDRFELPVVVQNQTDSPMTVDVAVRASNAELTEGAGRRVVVPANDRAEVRLPVAASRAGTARFQMAAVAGRWADAAEIELPVWTPATTEAFATYGELDEGAIVQPVRAPTDVFKQFGGLEVTTSSTQLQELTDAVLYLTAYPYECSEQLASRVLAVAALRDVLAAFAAKGLPTPDEMKAAVARDIKRLQGLQNRDGGFGFWRRGEESWPYVSIHAAHALQRARAKDFEVPEEMYEAAKKYLQTIEQHIPSNYPVDVRRALVAYALYVRNRMGERDAARARRLIAEAGLENLSLEAVGWLLPVLSGDAASAAQVEAIRRLFNNRASETAGAAHFTTSYTDGEYLLLHSERRADGIILEALIGDQPQSDLIPKVVRGLLSHRKAGRWTNTQENVFILLALDRYFATYEKATPDFVARAWLGERFAGEQAFKGRSTERRQVNVPMKYLAESASAQNLVLSKSGPGRLYYRVGVQYAPASLKLNAADYGFTVERVYEAVDNPSDVRRDADGTWHIKAGSRVRVRLTMAAPARRYHVALVDPIPAGLEALNPALAVTGTVPQDERSTESKARPHWWWSRPWFEHQNLRDERAEAFTPLLWEGVYTYSYVARATVPGDFVVPPAKAEEMYQPETFGRGASDRVRVE